ncbi:hypothetical protein K0M31_003172 [Melipona bicolor]|uniref:Uncharacterized protein n=1 Tax=Melipona bicolor TaxID=60889 RepID=A0AA40KP79_9HYME|nr:hypothetical protein K0M31_003172 [Melipona bicolor]
MWELGSRSVIVLVSVLSGCVFLYNVWGPIFILIVLLFLAVYAFYFLIINDSSLSPHAFLLLEHCKYISLEVCRSFKAVIDHVHQYIRQFLETAKRRFRQRYLAQASSTMERRRSGLYYQLSTDSYPTRRNSSHFGSITQLSPIPKSLREADTSNDVIPRNHFYHGSEHLSHDHHSFVGKRTSTPVFARNKEELENQTLKLSPPGQASSKKTSPLYKQNQALMQMENTTYFDAEGSSRSSVAALKTNSKAGEKKAVQTVAGPLLTSTRYNIDPKVYNDVTSPGLTARLTKYATEASNKLTHQSKYRVGQFPKVNLHANAVPVINVKSMRTRTPVTVNVAPSHAARYSSPSKQNILSNLCHSDDSYSSPNVAQALREISLKRHASREDVISDFAKKQRRDVVPSGKEFEIQEEVKQKRSRDDSLKSEDDTSPQSKIIRPAKRTKAPSCYDIINSLSSSRHVVSGVKRKARDFSRSGTPDFEKHFKSLECVQNASTQTSVQVRNTSPKRPNYELTERRNNSDACNSVDKLQEYSPLKGILKTSNKCKENGSDRKQARRLITQNNDKNDSVELMECTESAKLTDKLFMRAEPERNEKLRMLVEEQGNIRAKFTTDDVEEIKKEDITDMRQTSMKARLQSMFDAISGKAASRINPDVVIQAEEVNTEKSVASSPVTYVSLNSSTTTTNINTTPISTSAVALTPGTSESNTKSIKHVAFNLPGKDTGMNTNVQFVNTFEKKIENTSTAATDKTINVGTTFTSTKSEAVTKPVVSQANAATTNSTSSNVQNFNFGKPTSASRTSSIGNTTFTVDTASAKNKSPLLAATTTASIFQSVATAAPTAISSAISVSTVAANMRSEPNQSSNSRTNISQAAGNCSSSSSVSTESVKADTIFASSRTNLATLSNVTQKKEQNLGFASIGSKASVMPFTNITSSNNLTSTTSTMNTSTPSFTFGSNCPPSIVPAKSEGFVFGSSENSGAFGCSTTASRPTSMIPNSATPSSVTGSGAQANSVTVASASNAETQAKTSVSIFGSSISSTFALRPSTTSSVNGGKAVFSFGNASTATATTTTTTTTATTMTTTTTTNTTISSNAGPFGVGSNNLPPSFGTSSLSSTTSATDQAVSNASSIFTNASSTPSIFGATTASHQPVFGTSSNLNANAATFTLPKSTATSSVFGSNVTTTSSVFAPTSAIPIFSNITGGSSVNTTSIPVFGSSTSTPASGINPGGTSNVGSNLFSSTNSTTSASVFSTTNNIFGQVNSPSTDSSFKSGSGLFRNNNTGGPTLFASAQPTTTSATFGAANVSSNSTVSTFGASNVPASNNAPVPVFGAPATGTSDFASQNQNKGNPGTTNQHTSSTAQNFAAASSIFRTAENATGATVFGSSNDTAGHFNSAASSSGTFVGQNVISPNPTFGIGTTVTANGPPAFNDGNKASPFGTQPSTFGTPTMASTSVFASVNTNESNTAPGVFTFGASQKPPQQNTTTFSFGSNSNNNNNNSAASTSTPFQFGSTTSNSATGFNFSAPTTTPSINFGTTSSTATFNASTPGMFSIGSGSTAPRSRNIRTRKLR